MGRAKCAETGETRMKNANQKRLQLEFASYMVASMMERSGINILFSPSGWRQSAAQIIVLKDASTYQSIKVKYSESPEQVKSIWKKWLRSSTRGLDQLVVVTNYGTEVFAEPSIASMLSADESTTVTLLN